MAGPKRIISHILNLGENCQDYEFMVDPMRLAQMEEPTAVE